MDQESFDRLVEEVRDAHPRWFDFEADDPPGPNDILNAAQTLGVNLPEEYLSFVARYGGGDFAFAIVYSLDPNSDVNLIDRNREPWLSRSDFIAFSDNGCGDYYGFVVRDGHASRDVHLLDHESGEIRQTGDSDLYEFLLRVGLRQ